jgi:molybdopterin-dependent oxidoreductase alpha subunit
VSHRVRQSLVERLKVLVPFGVGRTKPHHFRDMLKVARENRDNWRYAWRVLSQGVCDGCALGVAGFHDWTIDGVHLCMTRLNLLRLNTIGPLDERLLADVEALRGKSNRHLRELGRLPYPMLREAGDKGFRRIAWDEAYERTAQRIRATTPDRLAFYLTSRGITNEVYYVAQKVARFLGTNNIDNAARLCHSPSTGAMKTTLGVGASTCSYKDWFGTDLLIFFGANPANDQPVAMKYIHRAKKQGTQVVMVNPYREPGMTRYWVPSETGSALFGTSIADHWFPVTIGGDIAFITGVMKVMIENGWINRSFIDEHTMGFDELRESVRAASWEALEASSGLSRSAMAEFAGLIAKAKTAVLVWSMGITQHAFGAGAVQMILNLGLSRAFVGRERCGLMPIRGHSGVQGGAEMGAYATALPGGKAIDDANARELSAAYGFDVPSTPGLSATEMVEAADRGELDLLYCLGGNFLRTLPDPDYVERAMAKVPLRVHQDIILTDQMFIDPSNAGDAVLLLPAKTRYEQDDGGTETTTERRVIFSPELPRPVTHPVGEARAEWKILLDLAAAAYPERAHQLGCETGPLIRQEIAKIIPAYAGIKDLKESGDQFQYGGARLCENFNFPTPDRKAHFRAVPLPDSAREPGAFRLTTRRGKQFNTLIYAETDPLTGASRDAVFMNPDDAAALRLKQGDRVTLVNARARYDARVHLAPLAAGTLQAHWPEANVLIETGVEDPIGKVPDYNATVRVEKPAS